MRTIKETLIEIQTTSVEITVYEELENIVKSMIMPPADTLRLNRITSRTVISEGYYYVPDDIIVKEDGELIIESGVQLNFAQGKGIVAFGKLLIDGAPDNMIIITGEGWSNISIIGEKSEGTIVNAIIYNGNGRDKIQDAQDSAINSNSFVKGGNIYSEYTNLSLVNTILIKGEAEIGGGLYCFSGGLNADNIIVYKNTANSGAGGGGVNLSNLKIIRGIYSNMINSKIIGNYSLGTGGVDISTSRIVVDNNLIKFNNSSMGCGGVNLDIAVDIPISFKTDIRILNNTIENNIGFNCGGINFTNNKPSGDDLLTNTIRNNNSELHGVDNFSQFSG